MDNLKRVTLLPTMAPGELEQRPPNPARAVQSFVGEVVSFVAKPLDMLNHGVAEWTRGVAKALGTADSLLPGA